MRLGSQGNSHEVVDTASGVNMGTFGTFFFGVPHVKRTMWETSLCVSASTLQALCGTHRNTHSMHNEEASTHCFFGAATG